MGETGSEGEKMPSLYDGVWKRDPEWRVIGYRISLGGGFQRTMPQVWKPNIMVCNRSPHAKYFREDKGEMRASYFAVLMILYAVANIFAVWLGVDEMKELNKLTGLISFVVLSIYYIMMGLYYMITKRNITPSPPS